MELSTMACRIRQIGLRRRALAVSPSRDCGRIWRSEESRNMEFLLLGGAPVAVPWDVSDYTVHTESSVNTLFHIRVHP
jgi:hypothetical protein